MEHIAIMEPMNEDYENLEIECRDINNPIEFDEKQQPIMQQWLIYWVISLNSTAT